MNTVLWALQIFTALIFVVSGTMKLVVPREQLSRRMRWAADWPRWRIRLLGLAELAGAAGLILPTVTGIAAVLTPLAAVCLALLMAGAITTHRRLREGFFPAAIVAALCVGIALGQVSAMRHAHDLPARELLVRWR